jgi:hypothetical protein
MVFWISREVVRLYAMLLRPGKLVVVSTRYENGIYVNPFLTCPTSISHGSDPTTKVSKRPVRQSLRPISPDGGFCKPEAAIVGVLDGSVST